MSMLPAKDLLERLASQPSLGAQDLERAGQMAADLDRSQIVHVEHLPERPPRYAAPSPPLPDLIQRAIASLGITQLYTHQAEAIERVRAGEDVVVVTATSSGKTLCYNLPILETILQERDARALYIYPINALVNDQLKGLMRLNLSLGRQAAGIARYTGSLNSDQRRAVRARDPNIMLTNPEMVHLSFLLWHRNWEAFWSNLRYIVIDEVHTYRGVFGSNMAHLFRRVLRMAAHYGAHPRFICCSATIANPGELVESLTGRECSVVDSDGAGRGQRHFVLWNPPLVGSDEDPSLRRSYADEAVHLMRGCIAANYNTIVFARARSLTERMLRLAQGLDQESSQAEESLGDRIASYRAGYLANEREDIENKLKSGELQGVITTNALELGIDIGDLDAAIIAGYPGTIMSTWQQAGRAGRRGRESLVFMVASQNPLDQYYVNHPQEFFAQPHELAVVDLDNQPIMLKHLLCAARELPFSPTEVEAMAVSRVAVVAELRQRGMLAPGQDDETALAYSEERRDIHFRISLRSAGHETYRILDEHNNEVGTIEPPNVFREAHPGAIYQHAGDDYRVSFLDRRNRIVRVRAENAPHHTRAFSTLKLDVSETYASRTIALGDLPLKVSLGEVLIEERVRSYQELVLGSDELVKRVNLSYPLAMRLHTTGMWIHMPHELVAELRSSGLAGTEAADPVVDGSVTSDPHEEGLHAVQHLLASVLPLLVMCDRRDIGGYYQVDHPDTHCDTVFVYDSYEGGIGLSEIAYASVENLLSLARDTVAQCRCPAGCPSCIQWGACRMHNESLDKTAALTILGRLTGAPQPSQVVAGHGAASTIQQRQPVAQLGPVDGATPHGLNLAMRAIDELDALTVRIGLSHNPAKEEKPPEQQYAAGDAVVHSSYGRGAVVSSRLEGRREWVTVRFMRRGMVREMDASKGMLRRAGEGKR